MLTILMPDPILIAQIIAALFIVLTLPANSVGKELDKASVKIKHEPFMLNDGNSYVEHAGMTIEKKLYQALHLH